MSNIIGELMSVVASCVNSNPAKPLDQLISEQNVASGSTTSRINIVTLSPDLYGQTVICTIGGGETLTGTMSDSGTCSFNVRYLGTYTLTCGIFTSQCSVTQVGGIYDAAIGLCSTLKLTTTRSALIGKSVTCSISNGDDSETLTGTFSSGGVCTFYVQYIGTYTVTCEGFSKKYVVTDHNLSYNETFGILYGFHIANSTESDPSTKVTYLEDAVGMTPAYMDYDADSFNYGSWENAFFMPRPCMLTYSGMVDYYLDPNDLTKREDGVTASDVANTSYVGNAMMEWGKDGNIIYVKYTPDTDSRGISIYITDTYMGSDFRDWSFINSKNVKVDHFYTPIYFGSLVDSKMRSLSGQTHYVSGTAQNEIDYAKANNTGSDVMWYTETWSDRLLINALLVLMAKTTDTQTAYGLGRSSGNSSALASGTMNTKGLFWGSTDGTLGVKVFGMEHYWGNIWRRIAGLINVKGTQKVKMTYGKYDGSTATSYNLTGDGYITLSASAVSSNISGYITDMLCTVYGLNPLTVGGSSSTHYTDYTYISVSDTYYAIVGGYWSIGLNCGAFCVALNNTASSAYTSIGSALSCRPC